MKNVYILFALIFVLTGSSVCQTPLQTVTGFGSNPGNLNMHVYLPTGTTGKTPLVLALHGCGQDATVYATQTGWNKLAQEHGFYVVYPEQNIANNGENCFNWFLPHDQTRGQGEALSIAQMVYYMQAHYNIDSTRIFITGLSAGACMTDIMLACYPDIFNAGAIMAGVPYKASTSALQSDSVLLGLETKTPQAWGDSVRSAYPGYTGSYPRVAVFQGTADVISNPINAVQVMEQWTNVDGATQTPASIDSPFNANPLVSQNIYDDTAATPVVETFFITGMPHGIALDTGSCYQQGGQTGPYALQVHLYSSFWAAYFFNLIGNDSITISGLPTVVANQQQVTYTVANTTGATYYWTVPEGAVIVSGQGTHQITVNFGLYAGNISVTEKSGDSCETGPAKMFVTVTPATAITQIQQQSAAINIYPNPATGVFLIETQTTEKQNICIFDLAGKLVLNQTIYGSTYIDAGGLSNGVYIVKIAGNTVNENRRVIVSR